MDSNINNMPNQGGFEPLKAMMEAEVGCKLAEKLMHDIDAAHLNMPMLHQAPLTEVAAGRLLCILMDKTAEGGVYDEEGNLYEGPEAVKKRLQFTMLSHQIMMDSMWKKINGEKGSLKIRLEIRDE